MAESAASSAVQKAASTPDPLLGRLINDRFKVMSVIARGGMGKVYRAEQAPLGRVCALKVLNPNYAGDSDPEFHKRFFLEASIAAKLTHPNTVTIFDYGHTEDDIYYIAMEYLEGHTLHRAIKEEAPIAEERAAHIARQICRALREAHSLGVIHRDLKPANIYLVEHADEADFVKVLDFGLVKQVDGTSEDLTQAGLFMGSPKYMSPEQIRGDKVDARTDIYSLGIVLYEMITGKVPFDRANSVNILMAHVNEPPPPLRQMNPDIDISPQIEEVIGRCIMKSPDDRFSSMDEVLAALKRTGAGAMTGTMMGAAATGEYASLQGSGLFGSGPNSVSGSGPQNPLFLSPGTGSQSGPIPSVGSSVPSSPPEPKKSKAALFGVLGLVAVVAVGGYAMTRGTPVEVPTTPAAAPSAPAPKASEPVAAPPPTEDAAKRAPARVVVRVESDPPGATVRFRDKEGDELCRETPCEVTLKGENATAGREIKLLIAKKGFSPETKTVRVGTDEKVSVKLAAAAAGGVAPGRPPPPGDPGFKPVPY